MTRSGTRSFLLEVGCEEIPAGTLPAALADLSSRLVASLGAGGILGGDGFLVPFGTPRRLVASLEGLREREEDRVVEVTGPPVAAAYDKEGRPTKAAIGFARAQGVHLEQLERVKGDKGEVIAAKKQIAGRAAAELLAEACPKVLGAMRFPKMMKWGDKGHCFVRPVQWIVALLGDDVVDFEFMGVRSGRLTRGHRFLSPGPHEIRRADEYESILAERGRVIVRVDARRGRILEQRARAAGAMGWVVDEDEPLLTELVFLNEYPGVIAGAFPKTLLELPEPVLITAMKHHQKYFPAREKGGALAPGFLAVINLESDPDGRIRRGNEWVLKARLADARFFWGEDRKRRLEDRVADLARVSFQEKLGSNLSRVERIEKLTAKLALDFGLDPGAAADLGVAARLCKTDLTTGMVGEFPELQGIMGGIYARADGLSEPVARAIEEQYLPISSGPCPSTAAGCLLSLADKVDLLAGCFAVKLIPKGSADPYGLRRSALGICRILMGDVMGALEGRVSLGQIVSTALEGHAAQGIAVDRGTADAVLDFLAQRVRFMMEESGMRVDTARAVLAAGADDVRDAWLRATSLTALRRREHEADFDSLATSAKRIRNILAQARAKGHDPGKDSVAAARLVDTEEKDLHGAVTRVAAGVDKAVAGRNYETALRQIASLRSHIDRFFEKVLVMAPDEPLRRNRLALLSGLSALLSRVADFSEIVVEGESTGESRMRDA